MISFLNKNMKTNSPLCHTLSFPRKTTQLALAVQGASKSQYVKQELRALCNTRAQGQPQSAPDTMSSNFDSGEIPMDILDSSKLPHKLVGPLTLYVLNF